MDKVTGVKLGPLRPRIQKVADRENRTLSGMIKHILKNWLVRNESKKTS